MVVAVRTEEAHGGLVVVKEARSDGDVTRLGREATMLARCRHPGVVELLEVGERSITLRHAGTALARLGPFPADQAAGIVVAVADVVQALHRLGVVHGDLDAGHVLLDQRGRPRLAGFGQAAEHTPEGAADDVAALGRLLGWLLQAGEDLPWARPPSGLRRRSEQRQARRDLEAIAAQATREQRSQRPTARQLSKAVHAAVPDCSLPVPGAPRTLDERPAYAEIPTDVDPTADISWTSEELSWLSHADAEAGTGDEFDDVDGGDPQGEGAYGDLRGLAALSFDDVPEDWAELAAHPEAVTGPLPIVDAEEQPIERARIEVDTHLEPEPVAPGVTLPARSASRPPERRRWSLAWMATLVVVLVLGVVGGVAGARAVRPLADDPPPPTEPAAPADATDDVDDVSGDEGDAPRTDAGAAPTEPVTWPADCDLPDPAGPDADGDGCPDPVTLDGRTATVGPVTVVLGQDGDQVALGDWDCDGTATPALLRPDTGEVFVFPRWSLDEPLEVAATTVVPGAEAIEAGDGTCPELRVRTDDGVETVAVTG